MELKEYKEKIANLTIKEQNLRDLYLKKISLGDIQGPNTGYPSLDKPWLKYYKDKYIEAEVPHMTAYEYLKKLNQNNLKTLAFDCGEYKCTFQDFFDLVEKQIAVSLYYIGVKKGEKVLMMLPPTIHENALFYGTDITGGAISEIPIESSLDDIVTKINKYHSSIFFISSFLLDEFKEKEIYNKTDLKNIIVIGEYDKTKYNDRTISWKDFLKIGEGKKLPKIDRNPEDLLFIASTGGSTGEPKGVMLNDNCFNIAVHELLNSDLNYNSGDRWLRLWSLFSATAAVSNNHLPLCAGMTNIIRNFPLNINDFDKMIFNEKSNHLMLIPQLLDVLEKSSLISENSLSYIKTVGCGGLAITPEFEKKVSRFFNKHQIDTYLGFGWGCTENSGIGSMRSNFDTSIVGTVGAPQVKASVSVFNPETGEELGYGEEGELCIKSSTLMMGYYGDEELTSKVLKIHKDGTLWLHTGDLGHIDSNGIVTVKGRMTRTIFVFPTAKIYPTALENIISKIPGVSDVVIGEIPDSQHENFGLPVCFIIPNGEVPFDLLKENINKTCEFSLASYARPHCIYFYDEFPLTKVGKKDVRALENMAQADELSKIKKLK